jgi:hypothetical protein
LKIVDKIPMELKKIEPRPYTQGEEKKGGVEEPETLDSFHFVKPLQPPFP